MNILYITDNPTEEVAKFLRESSNPEQDSHHKVVEWGEFNRTYESLDLSSYGLITLKVDAFETNEHPHAYSISDMEFTFSKADQTDIVKFFDKNEDNYPLVKSLWFLVQKYWNQDLFLFLFNDNHKEVCDMGSNKEIRFTDLFRVMTNAFIRWVDPLILPNPHKIANAKNVKTRFLPNDSSIETNLGFKFNESPIVELTILTDTTSDSATSTSFLCRGHEDWWWDLNEKGDICTRRANYKMLVGQYSFFRENPSEKLFNSAYSLLTKGPEERVKPKLPIYLKEKDGVEWVFIDFTQFIKKGSQGFRLLERMIKNGGSITRKEFKNDISKKHKDAIDQAIKALHKKKEMAELSIEKLIKNDKEVNGRFVFLNDFEVKDQSNEMIR